MDRPVDPAAPTLTWVAFPLRRRRALGALVLTGIVIVALGLGSWTRSAAWGFFAFVALFVSLETFFFPSRYEAGEAEIVVRSGLSTRRLAWSSCRRVYEDRWGLTLSPYGRESILEPYRSIRLLFDGVRDAEVRAWVRARCPAAEWRGPGTTAGAG
jgi:hypothetical protein